MHIVTVLYPEHFRIRMHAQIHEFLYTHRTQAPSDFSRKSGKVNSEAQQSPFKTGLLQEKEIAIPVANLLKVFGFTLKEISAEYAFYQTRSRLPPEK